MPKSIFDIIKDRYGIHGERLKDKSLKGNFHTLDHLLNNVRLKDDFTTVDKIFLFRFLYNVKNALDVNEEPFF